MCVCVSLNKGQKRVPYFKEQSMMENPGPSQLGSISSLGPRSGDPVYSGNINQQDQFQVMDRSAEVAVAGAWRCAGDCDKAQ